jgi:hypothetical protein
VNREEVSQKLGPRKLKIYLRALRGAIPAKIESSRTPGSIAEFPQLFAPPVKIASKFESEQPAKDSFL